MIVLIVVAALQMGALFWLWGKYQSLESEARSLQFNVDRLTEDLRIARNDRHEQAEEYEDRVDSLLQQVRDYAEKLTSMTEKGFTPTKEQRAPDAEEEEPYSPDLRQLLGRIESAEARQLVEQDIQQRRAEGVADEQIYREIVEAGEDPWI